MKFRIVEQDGLFYPEQRIFFIWCRFGRDSDICYQDIRDARWFLNEKISTVTETIIHAYP